MKNTDNTNVDGLRALKTENKALKKHIKHLQREFDKLLQSPVVKMEHDKKILRREARRKRRQETKEAKQAMLQEVGQQPTEQMHQVEQSQSQLSGLACTKCEHLEHSIISMSLRDGKNREIRICKKCKNREIRDCLT